MRCKKTTSIIIRQSEKLRSVAAGSVCSLTLFTLQDKLRSRPGHKSIIHYNNAACQHAYSTMTFMDQVREVDKVQAVHEVEPCRRKRRSPEKLLLSLFMPACLCVWSPLHVTTLRSVRPDCLPSLERMCVSVSVCLCWSVGLSVCWS